MPKHTIKFIFAVAYYQNETTNMHCMITYFCVPSHVPMSYLTSECVWYSAEMDMDETNTFIWIERDSSSILSKVSMH